ncbi:hypothetical protein Mgra_00002147 [Meloidogyne graminicola]|uniref:NNMT/PNMT/TEMT family protein n=1 Tax=Meloidogyne graminicola TaxID=189291 RepID=A0A8S9ZYX8_9BILA|nr:hypothetical protein Mgra_00002147 [Meloidogyne graminicola]
MTIIKENENNLEILNRNHFHEYFNTEAYLKDFYSKIEDPAMQLIIFHLPSILARLPLNINYLLDFGSGPTIYVAICFREKAKNIFLSDYLPQNRNELKLWLNGNSNFNWTNVLKLIAVHEAIPPPSFSDFTKMEQMAREKVRDIIHCDCHISPSIQLNSPKYFDVITTFLTIEYCCLNKEEYKNAIKRLSALLVPKEGILIMGGVLEKSWCAFGGHRFSCLYIKKEFLLNTLEEAGLEIFKDSIGTKLFYERDGIFLLVAKKVIEEKNEENYEEIRMKG